MLDFLNDTAESVARRLLGCVIEREIDGKKIWVKIVETEAYDQYDAASHSHKGKTLRSSVMFGPSGHLYVYFTYGMHYCCNIVTGPTGTGSAVLIRAVEPLVGEDSMRKLRNKPGVEISNGPAKLCQALGIDKKFNGHDLTESPIKLVIQTPVKQKIIAKSKRIGVKEAVEKPWRFYIKNNPYVSRQ